MRIIHRTDLTVNSQYTEIAVGSYLRVLEGVNVYVQFDRQGDFIPLSKGKALRLPAPFNEVTFFTTSAQDSVQMFVGDARYFDDTMQLVSDDLNIDGSSISTVPGLRVTSSFIFGILPGAEYDGLDTVTASRLMTRLFVVPYYGADTKVNLSYNGSFLAFDAAVHEIMAGEYYEIPGQSAIRLKNPHATKTCMVGVTIFGK